MKTLDEDAEILKRRAENSANGANSSSAGSGRKVGQAGLGAFKILNKYSNLTSKYREPEKTKPNVPQEKRGTIPDSVEVKSVQSQGEVSATLAPTSINSESIKPVQSPGEVSANKSAEALAELPAKSVQNSLDSSEVRAALISEVTFANPIGSQVLVSADGLDLDNSPQDQLKVEDSGCKVSATIANHGLHAEPAGVDEDSARLQDETLPREVRAIVRAENFGLAKEVGSDKSVQSPGEVSATSNYQKANQADRKSVQSECKVGAESEVDDARILIPTKSVQSPGDVVFKDVELASSNNANEETEVRAKPVQETFSVTRKDQRYPHSQSPDARAASEEMPASSSRIALNDRPEQQFTIDELNPSLNSFGAKKIHEHIQSPAVEPSQKIEHAVADQLSPKSEKSHAVGPKNQFVAENTINEDSEKTYVTEQKLSFSSDANTEMHAFSRDYSNSVQTQGKVSANEVQSGFIVRAKVSAKSVQTRGEVGSIVSANQDKKIHLIETDLHPLESVTSLTGTQRIIIEFLYDQCVFNNSLVTPPISKQQLLASTSLNEETALSSIKRLRKKLIIDREAYKDGKAGWTQYRLSDISYKELLNFRQSHAKSVQSPGEVGSKVSSKVGANLSSKIDSHLKNNNLLTPDELDEIDFSATTPFGITRSIVADIRKNNWKLSRHQIESHLERFATWASNPTNSRTIKNLRGLFCSNLKQISESGMDPFDFIKTESEQMMDQLLQKRRDHLEEMKKKQTALFEVEFETWLLETPRSTLEQLVPISNLAPMGSEIRTQSLKAYFLENIFSQ